MFVVVIAEKIIKLQFGDTTFLVPNAQKMPHEMHECILVRIRTLENAFTFVQKTDLINGKC